MNRITPCPLPARPGPHASLRRPLRSALWSVLGLLGLFTLPTQASQLVPQNLKQMIQAADVIVTGEVSKVSDGIDNGLPFTEVTMKVKGSVKRDLLSNSQYTFRQYGLLKTRRMADGRYMLATKMEGMPSWAVGEQVTTFMNKPSARSGMSTPVGLAQGKFTLSGTQMSNSFNNQDLFRGMSVDPSVLSDKESQMLSKQLGAVDSGVLNHLVKRAVKEQWIEKGVMR
ncbi:hypothetical protein WG899_19110 [Paucibacter sp. AS339]|uniref:hypothetical protein n=1 Tax=Paucibacter hankyongi TaxID=3133434 RepID=UPI0030A0518D